MGCLSGCFGGAKDRKRRKQRINRSSPQRQRNRDQNVLQQEVTAISEQSTKETITPPLVPELRTEPEVVEQQPSPTPSTKLVPELRTEPEVVEQQPSPSPTLSQTPSPKKRVTFNSNITAYEHISVLGSTDSLSEKCTTNSKNENQEDSKTSNQSHLISEEDNSITSSVASYPSNHRYHNAVRDSDDETEEYGDSDLDDLDEDDDDEDNDYGYGDEDDDAMILDKEIWSESVSTQSLESRTGYPSRQDLSHEMESPMMLGSKANSRDRSDYINSVLNPVENITQWKAVKSKGTKTVLKPQKENSTADAAANFESPRASFSLEPTFKKKTDQLKNTNQGIAVDTSLSNWLGSPEIMSSKKTSFSGSEGRTSVRSYDDRPILGALTVEELRQFSASNSPRKSPSRNPDEMPIIGSVGTYWNNSISKKHSDSSSSFKGIPNTTSKYREDKRVNWHSTPFETRLDRALNRGAAEA